MSQSTDKMVVKVEISADVYLVCLVQALSTEKEEVMGLLIGEARFKLSREMLRAFHSVPGLRLGSFKSDSNARSASLLYHRGDRAPVKHAYRMVYVVD